MPSKILGFVNIAINTDIKGLETGLTLAKKRLSGAVSSFGTLAKTAGDKIGKGLATTGRLGESFDNAGFSAGALFAKIGKLADALSPVQRKFTTFGITGGGILKTLGKSISSTGVGFAGLLNPIGLAQVAVKTFASLTLDNIDLIIKGMTKFVNRFIDVYNNSILVRGVIQGLVLNFKNMFQIVKAFVRLAVEGFSAVFQLISAGFSRDFAKIPSIVAGVYNSVGDIISDGADAIEGNLTTAIDNTLNGKLEYVSEETIRKIVGSFINLGDRSAKEFYNRWLDTVNSFKFNISQKAIVKTELQNATDLKLPNIEITDQNQKGIDIYKGVAAELDLITQKQNVYGISIDSGLAKIDAYRDGLTKLLEEGFSAGSLQVNAFSNTLKELEQSEVATLFDDVALRVSNLTEKQNLLGVSFDSSKEKQDIFNESFSRLSQIMGGEVSPALVRFLEQMILVDEALNTISVDVSEVFKTAIDGVTAAFGEAFTGAQNFGDALTGAFDGVLKSIASVMDQLGNAAIFQGKTIEAMKLSFQSFGGFGAIAAGIALKVFAGLIKSTVANITPKLAQGGLAFGETLAVVGDNPNARTDPEVIAPLSKLKQYIGQSNGGQNQVLSAVVSGSDLRFVLQQAEFENQYTSGN